jgi:hypothetical protein
MTTKYDRRTFMQQSALGSAAFASLGRLDAGNAAAQQAPGAGELEKNFASPPASAKPWVYWYWCKGSITRETLTAELEWFSRLGAGGVLLMNGQVGAVAGEAVVRFGSAE